MDKEREYMTCPLNNKICSNGVNDSAPKHPITKQKLKCRWWRHLAGKDPQSDQSFDMGDCSIPWGPVTAIENAQMTRQTGASMDKVANQANELKTAFGNVSVGIQNLARAMMKISSNQKVLIEQNLNKDIHLPTNGHVEVEEDDSHDS